jgi:hypothetical protein
VHRPGQRMAGGVAAPGRGGARGAGHRRAVTGRDRDRGAVAVVPIMAR